MAYFCLCLEFQKIYDRLDIKLVERGESFYQNLMKKTVTLLEEAGVLVEDEGRKVMFAPGLSVPLTVVKSDGGYTYDTSDMAAIRQRIYDEGANWVVYVVDLGQAGHFETIFACAEVTGWLDRKKTRVEHVGKTRIILAYWNINGKCRDAISFAQGSVLYLAKTARNSNPVPVIPSV